MIEKRVRSLPEIDLDSGQYTNQCPKSIALVRLH